MEVLPWWSWILVASPPCNISIDGATQLVIHKGWVLEFQHPWHLHGTCHHHLQPSKRLENGALFLTESESTSNLDLAFGRLIIRHYNQFIQIVVVIEPSICTNMLITLVMYREFWAAIKHIQLVKQCPWPRQAMLGTRYLPARANSWGSFYPPGISLKYESHPSQLPTWSECFFVPP